MWSCLLFPQIRGVNEDSCHHVLRLLTGVILCVVAVVLVLIGVEVAVAGTFSVSESVSPGTVNSVWFLVAGAISFSNSFWFSTKIFAKSDIISFLIADFISSRISVCTLGDLLVPTTGFNFWLFPTKGVSFLVETSSSTAFPLGLLVVILRREREKEIFGNLEFFKEKFSFHKQSIIVTERLLIDSITKPLGTYTFSASFVPHLKIPRNP